MSDALVRLERLEEVRTRLGLNRSEMAVRCGKKPQQYSDWVTGRKQIGEKLARGLEATLGLPRYYLDERPGEARTPPSPTGSKSDPVRKTLRIVGSLQSNAEYAGPATLKRTPVVGTARMGDDGYYEELDYPAGNGDGSVPSICNDPNAYAIRVKGESMHPVIKHGWFIVAAPNRNSVPGEFVVVGLRDGRKMVKELIFKRPDGITVESANGGHRQGFDWTEIDFCHAVACVIPPSHWTPD